MGWIHGKNHPANNQNQEQLSGGENETAPAKWWESASGIESREEARCASIRGYLKELPKIKSFGTGPVYPHAWIARIEARIAKGDASLTEYAKETAATARRIVGPAK